MTRELCSGILRDPDVDLLRLSNNVCKTLAIQTSHTTEHVEIYSRMSFPHHIHACALTKSDIMCDLLMPCSSRVCT